MKVLYNIPSLESIYAARFIYEGYKDAFLDLGHEFKSYTSKDFPNLEKILKEYNPDIFISSLHRYNLKFLDLHLLKRYREKGMVSFMQIPSWKKQSKQMVGGDLENDGYLVKLIKEGLAGDIFYNWFEQDDSCMDGFTKTTGYPFHTIILAANINLLYPEYDERYKADISFVGSFLPAKRKYMRKHVLPLREKYDVKLYGSDWTLGSRFLGYVQKIGQYFNINSLKQVRKLNLPLEDERKVYSSSLVSINLHEDHQRDFGSDFNERTFKIIAAGGFQVVDNVAVLKKYFSKDELVIAENTKDWFEKIDYYVKNPEKRIPIIKAGRKKVLEKHTYYNRVNQIIDIYEQIDRLTHK